MNWYNLPHSAIPYSFISPTYLRTRSQNGVLLVRIIYLLAFYIFICKWVEMTCFLTSKSVPNWGEKNARICAPSSKIQNIVHYLKPWNLLSLQISIALHGFIVNEGHSTGSKIIKHPWWSITSEGHSVNAASISLSSKHLHC